MAVAIIWSSLATSISRPQTKAEQQQQVLYSASKGVNSSVGLCFFVATSRNDLISVGGHKKNTDLQFFSGPFRIFCSHSALPTKIIDGNLFVFVFLWCPIGLEQGKLMLYDPCSHLLLRLSLLFLLLLFLLLLLFRKNLNASKPSEHPPQVEECLKV